MVEDGRFGAAVVALTVLVGMAIVTPASTARASSLPGVELSARATPDTLTAAVTATAVAVDADGAALTIAATQPYRRDLFARSVQGTLLHRAYVDGLWSDWEDLGGSISSAPAVASWGAGRLDVFARGTDNTLRHRVYAGGAWTAWESLAGALTSAPSVVSTGTGRLDVFARGTANALVQRSFTGAWGAWTNLAGSLTSAPTAVTWGGGRIDVFARGTGNTLQQRFFQANAWSAWFNLGGVLSSAPSATSWGLTHLEVLSRTTGNTLMQKTYEPGWSGFIDRGGAMASAPAAVSAFVDELDVYGVDAAGEVQQRTMPGGWGPLRRLGNLPVTAPPDPTTFDPGHAAQVRADRCRLGFVLNTGGPAMKSEARTALVGSDEAMHSAAQREYPGGAALSSAYQRDHTADEAKALQLDARSLRWERLGGYSLPGVSPSEFQTPPDYFDDLSNFLRDRIQFIYSFYYQELAPAPGEAPLEAVRQIANARYHELTSENEDEWHAWHFELDSGNPHADDYRMFLQYGGFASVAPTPGSAEFRVDVEALKARFASCDSRNPIDPHGVLGDEVTTAGLKWQAELDAQAELRNDIVTAEWRAGENLVTAAEAMSECMGWAWVAGQFVRWQAYWQAQPVNRRPSAAAFTAVAAEVTNAQQQARAQLPIANAAASAASAQATKVGAAQEEAGRIATANGTPFGRGLAYAQQAAQVTKAAAAATTAAARATQTAVNATMATAATSAGLLAAAQAQGHASEAEFLRAAAQEAAAQAHNAAAAAKAQATQAAQAATRARADRIAAEQAEQAAGRSAERADQQRAIAEREQRIAAAERVTADAERARAARAQRQAEADAATAEARRGDADAAADTAAQRRTEAEQAEGRAATARNEAISAEGRRDALVARAEAAEAREDATVGTSAATEARNAATRARGAADAATDAAVSARSAADRATTAATNARAAATRATAAANRARAAADRAKAAAAETHAHAQAAHAAAADAIAAAGQAAENVWAAKALVAEARTRAAEARADAVAAREHADAARANSATATGQASASLQWAAAARDSAAEVIRPANEAIDLGGRYRETDTSAALAVLVGQSSKTYAEQQAAVAQSRIAQAAQAARDAQEAADRADAAAKAAVQAAADAAKEVAAAAQSLQEARVSAAAAAADANGAVRADQHAAQLDRQAQEDAASAETAAQVADRDASAARDAATDAERNAADARSAADAAEADASAARDSADQAERDATAAETAAANADASAREAQDAATRTQADIDARGAAAALRASGPAGEENVEAQADVNDEVVGNGPCQILGGQQPGHCSMVVLHHLTGEIIYRLKTCPDPDETYCPGRYTTDYLGARAVDLRWDETVQVPILAVLDQFWRDLAWGTVSDYVNCATRQGDDWHTACAWAIGSIVVPYGIGRAARSIMTLRVAMRTGVGIDEAMAAVRASEIDAAAVAQFEQQAARATARICGSMHSFDGRTLVVMADGSRRSISTIGVGDRVRTTDPATGRVSERPVSMVWRHVDTDLTDVTVRDRHGRTSVLHTTRHHPFWDNSGRRWVQAANLAIGTVLRADNTGTATVAAIHSFTDRQYMFDLTVRDVHTYYVVAGNEPVLVHNVGCDEWAAVFQQRNGGVTKTFVGPGGSNLPMGAYRPGGQEVGESWFHHTVVVKDGKVFDQWHPRGIEIDRYKELWDYGDDIDFGF